MQYPVPRPPPQPETGAQRPFRPAEGPAPGRDATRENARRAGRRSADSRRPSPLLRSSLRPGCRFADEVPEMTMQRAPPLGAPRLPGAGPAWLYADGFHVPAHRPSVIALAHAGQATCCGLPNGALLIDSRLSSALPDRDPPPVGSVGSSGLPLRRWGARDERLVQGMRRRARLEAGHAVSDGAAGGIAASAGAGAAPGAAAAAGAGAAGAASDPRRGIVPTEVTGMALLAWRSSADSRRARRESAAVYATRSLPARRSDATLVNRRKQWQRARSSPSCDPSRMVRSAGVPMSARQWSASQRPQRS